VRAKPTTEVPSIKAQAGDARELNNVPTNMTQIPPTSRSLVGASALFAASMVKFAASGFKTVDEPLHELRTGHCQPCEYRKNTQCSLCRCFIAKKAWLPHEDCPIGRWPT